MAKELPYFRFYVGEWLNKDITLHTMENQGIFINVCAYYWLEECELTFEKLSRRYPRHLDGVNKLIADGIINMLDDDVIDISFLNEQWAALMEKHVKLSKAGKKGGRSGAKARLKHRSSYKDKDKDNNKDKDNYRAFAHLSISGEEFNKLFLSYSKQQIDSTLDSIENFKGNTKYKSLYLTAKKWLEKERKTKETTLGGRDIKLEKVREGYGERTPQDVKMPDSLKKKFGIK